MILGVPTKYSAGLTLYGDFWDLKSLYETIHEIVEPSPFHQDIKDTVLGLAYDIRHAYQRDREEETFGHDDYDKVTYRGTKILWPIVLFQVNTLRYFASFGPTTRGQQANLYRLEACLESVLNEVDQNIASKCIEWLHVPSPLTTNYYCLYLSEASRRYLLDAAGKNRFKKLPSVLQSFHPMSTDYRKFAEHLESVAKEKGCSPHDLGSSDDYDFKW